MSKFLFVSQVPADLAKTTEAAVISALEASGMSGVTIAPATEKFGEKILVANAPALPVGTKFMIVQPTVVTATARNSNEPTTYDAFVILLSTGETRVIAASNLLNPWLPAESDMTKAQKELFTNYPESLVAINAFHKANDNSKVANSYVSGFTVQSSLEARMKALSGVIEVVSSETFSYSGTVKKTGEAFDARQRLYALTNTSDNKKIEAFAKAAKAGAK